MSAIDELLGRTAPEGTRLRALDLLDLVRDGRRRLDDPADVEAMHDFRVAMRRLRSLLKAHQPLLGGKIGKLRKELGDVAEATGVARDAEVQLEWLAGERRGLSAAHRPALVWLMAELEKKKSEGYQAARTEAGPAFDAVEARLRARLSSVRVDLTSMEAARSFAAELAEKLRDRATALAASLAEVGSAGDEEKAHEARIVGKQLRYLLEPLAESARVGAEATTTVAALKSLQDVLGELHDSHVLGHVVTQAIVEAATAQARRVSEQVFAGRRSPAAPRVKDLRPGLVAIAGRVRARRDKLHADLLRQRRKIGALIDRVSRLVGVIAPRAGEAAADKMEEIERKYLLRAMPPVAGAEELDIEQGYLPGDRLVERLRRTRAADGSVTLIRSMKLGTGIKRIEVEEEIRPELFRKLWPLTAGKRIRKVRFKVPDGDFVWEIDKFRGKALVLAEVELPSETTPVTPPPWLAGLIVREVTGEKAFTNEALAT